ncbi:Panacea domain-containing protein [Rummeliibacillus pycnus]|uniref:Panacea domain-containing protein n=1 Tax=Rummeliibacillus pycnus TaxID=101070 RepID=UPI000C9C19FE|nr:type II toxin-antitoxin system antitoxin SocA domain-containing protein [Rummeliibacillus pycnus]
MAKVTDVAKKFLLLSNENNLTAITPLKLQKLVYYAQAFHLKNNNERLFKSDILAWDHGPIVRILYDLYRDYGYHIIPPNPDDEDRINLTEKEIKTINKVFEEYGELNGKVLEEMTHQETPWLSTNRNNVISIDKIEEYFKS